MKYFLIICNKKEGVKYTNKYITEIVLTMLLNKEIDKLYYFVEILDNCDEIILCLENKRSNKQFTDLLNDILILIIKKKSYINVIKNS